jgi:hypothetical protein
LEILPEVIIPPIMEVNDEIIEDEIKEFDLEEGIINELDFRVRENEVNVNYLKCINMKNT